MLNPKSPANKKKNKNYGLYLFVMTVIFVLTYIMSKKELLPVYSDIRSHMNFSLSLDTVLAHSHCGWELLCWLCYACLPIPPEMAACIVNSLLNAAAGGLVVWMCEYMLGEYLTKENKTWLPAAVSITALLTGPLFLRFFNHRYYLGQGSPNPWHNPTFIGVRPFMIAITVITVFYWQMQEQDRVVLRGRSWRAKPLTQILLAVLLSYATLIKPSFLTIYLPACVLLVFVRLCRQKGKGFFRLLADHLYFLPSGLMLVWQYVRTYITGIAAQPGTGIAIRLFKAAGRYTDSVGLSWVLRMAFPAAVILIWHRQIRRHPFFPLILTEYVFGQAIAFIFTETGSRASHGNFGWGNMLGTSMIWIFCLIFFVRQYLEEETDRKKSAQDVSGSKTGRFLQKWQLKYALPALLLVWHLAAGIAYYYSLMGDPSRQL